MLNRAILIGRLVADPEQRFTQSGIEVSNFRLAIDRPFTNQAGEREADFIPIVAWDKQASSCNKNLLKGRLVAVEGRIQPRSYEAEDGTRRYVTEVIADSVRFLDSKRPSDDSSASSSAPSTNKDALEGIPF